MTNEQAIKWLKDYIQNTPFQMEQYERAFEMAIQALSQEPCDDAVSRESVDRILRDMGVNCAYDMPSFWANKGKDYKVIPTKWHKGYQQAVADFDKRIRELPSVTHRSGKWIRWREEVQRGTHYTENIPHCKCSECDTEYDIFASRFINYCPNCGCRMVEPQERSDKE